jgi:hypothetical protein
MQDIQVDEIAELYVFGAALARHEIVNRKLNALSYL